MVGQAEVSRDIRIVGIAIGDGIRRLVGQVEVSRDIRNIGRSASGGVGIRRLGLRSPGRD